MVKSPKRTGEKSGNGAITPVFIGSAKALGLIHGGMDVKTGAGIREEMEYSTRNQPTRK